MRARNIKPGFYKNESLAECSVWARFICPGLWMMADRNGRMEDRPKRIKAELLAYDAVEIEPLLQELIRHGHIMRYEARGDHYIQILKFKKHQTPHHTEKPSDLPEPPPYVAPPKTVRAPKGSESMDRLDAIATPGAPQECSGSNSLFHTPPLPPDSLIHRFTDSTTPDGVVAGASGKSGAKQPKLPNLSRLTVTSLPPEWAEWSHADMGWDAQVTADVWVGFRDYWQGRSGKTAKKSDWFSTWRNWCRNQFTRNRGAPNANTFRPVAESARPSKSERFKQALVESTNEELGLEGRPGWDKDIV